MANQTVYDIRLRYLLDDKASKGVGKIADEAGRAGRASGSLAGILGRIGGMVIGAFGARGAARALVGFNSDLEQAKITMAGMFELNMGGKWAKNMEKANTLVTQMQQDAKASVGTTKDFVDMAQLIARPITKAGGSMKDLREATKGAVIASRAFGIDPQNASRDIESALQGTLTQKDRFARALLEPMGFSTTQWNQMVKADPAKGIDKLMKALNSPAIKDMAKAQENSWAGVTSTLEDNLQMTIGKIGLPLFKALTKEVASWNVWLDHNQDKVKSIADSLSKGLVEGFGMVKSAISFLIDHKEDLLSIGKIWLAIKAGQMIGSMGGMLPGGMNSKVGSAGAGGWGGTASSAAGAAMAGWEIGKRLTEESALLGDTFADLNVAWRQNLDTARKLDSVNKDIDAMDAGVRNAHSRLQDRGGMFSTYMAAALGEKAARLRSDAGFAANAGGDRGWHQSKASALIGPLAGALLGSSGYSLRSYAMGANQAGIDRLKGRADQAATAAEVLPRTAQLVWINALATLNATSAASLDVEKSQVDVLNDVMKTLQNTGMASVPGMMQFLAAKAGLIMSRDQLGGSDDDKRSKAKANKPNVHVTISRIEVQSDDPDRMAFGLVEAFRDAARNPSHAFDTLREA